MDALTHDRAGGADVRQAARSVAVVAAVMTAVLYLMVGFGVVSVGRSSSGEAPDLLRFGLTAGVTFAVAAGLLGLFRSRVLWFALALLNVVVVVAYFALSDLREPPVELWGLLIKACQVVGFGALAYLTVRGAGSDTTDRFDGEVHA